MSGTEGPEEKLNQLLNDPESMAKILSMVKSLGLQPPVPDEPPPSAPPPVDEGMLMGMMQMMRQMQQTDGRQEALLSALKPYLAPERREKLDRAMQLAKISHLAGFALRNYGGK